MNKFLANLMLFLGLVLFGAGTGLSAPLASPATPKKIIVIDPGHGGADPGASAADGVHEKDVVFAFAKALKKELDMSGRYEVILTRDSDVFVPLETRVKIARDHQADLFLAIHADTLSGALLNRVRVRGMTIYTVSDKASDAEAAALAAKENQSDEVGGVVLGKQTAEISSVLVNLAQRESRAMAQKFASKTLEAIKTETNLAPMPLRSADFFVLKAPDVASALIELGYLSNTDDEAQLNSETWRTKMANAFGRAIDRYFSPLVSASGP